VPDRKSYEYAVFRIVPYVERQEFINAGVILFCRPLNFLDVLIDFELERLRTFAPQADLKMIRSQLKAIQAVCAGSDDIDAVSGMTQSERFSWLTSPSSTVIQISPVHSGVCTDPGETLKELFDFFVKRA
jgi:hypothetical protein